MSQHTHYAILSCFILQSSFTRKWLSMKVKMVQVKTTRALECPQTTTPEVSYKSELGRVLKNSPESSPSDNRPKFKLLVQVATFTGFLYKLQLIQNLNLYITYISISNHIIPSVSIDIKFWGMRCFPGETFQTLSSGLVVSRNVNKYGSSSVP